MHSLKTTEKRVFAENRGPEPLTGPRIVSTAIICWGSLFFFLWPGDNFFPAGVIGVWSFYLGPVFFPRCRFRRKPLITPLNWFLLGWFIQLVLMPVTIRIAGPLHAFLPELPSSLSINLVTILMSLGYIAFCGAFHFATSPKRAVDSVPRSTFWPIPRIAIILSITIGMLGLIFRFGSFGTFVHFLTAPAVYTAETARHGESASLGTAFSDFTSSFLPFGVILLWARRTERNVRLGMRQPFLIVLLLPLIAILFAMNSYNRSNFVLPMIAIAGALGIRAPRESFRSLATVFGLIGILVVVNMIYRFSSHKEDVDTGPSADVLSKVDTGELFQLYAQAPQYPGFMIQSINYGLSPKFGVVTLSSLLGNIPVVGKGLRPLGGSALFVLLTGHSEENANFMVETFWDLNVFGVILAYGSIGLGIAWLQRRYLSATHVLSAYFFQSVTAHLMIASMLGSVEVMGQFAVYNLFPMNAYLFMRAVDMRFRTKTRIGLR